MSDSRRRKLEDLQDREALKGRRARLQAMLIQKLAGKYGKKSTARRQVVEDMVTDFVTGTDVVTEQSLVDLETNIRDKVQQIKASERPVTSGEPSTTSSSSNKLVGGASLQSARSATSNRGGGDPSQMTNDWILLDVYRSIEIDEELKKQKQKAVAVKNKLREELEKQIRETEERQKREQRDRLSSGSDQRNKLELWKTEQDRLRREIHHKYYHMHDVRLAQIAEKKNRVQREKQERLAREQREIDACQKEIKRQEEEVQQKKLAERQRQVKIREEIEKEMQRRHLEKLREAEEDKRLMEEYTRKLEREEFERAHAFKKRVERMEKAGQKWAQEGAGKVKADMERAIEDIILREASRKEQADMERERRDREARRNNLRMMAAANKRMAEEKQKILAKEKEDDAKWSTEYRRQGEEYVRALKEARRTELEKGKKHMDMLKKQMEEHRRMQMIRDDNMTEEEKKINAAMLRRLQEDEDLMGKIQEKLLIGTKNNPQRPSPIGPPPTH